ncbi:MAG: hypothetical protein WD625_06375 [Balneolales bacterium]
MSGKKAEQRDKPRIHFVRGGAYIKVTELLDSVVGQKQLEEMKEFRETLQARKEEKNKSDKAIAY